MESPLKSLLLVLACTIVVSGCSVVAAPCRISGAVVKTVPLFGKVVAAPLDACGDIID
jgi:hypothetical protein